MSGESPTADESGGRSTGVITGFRGGQMGGGGSQPRGGGGGQTAVVKGRYVRSGNASKVKASARYYTTRENERGEGMERQAFSKDADNLDRQETYERLENADRDREYHYRMVLSPGTDRDAEGVDLKEYTREVMREVEHQQRGSSWVAVEHAGETAHTQRAHVHVIVSTDRKFDREELGELREHATKSWDEAKERAQPLERDQDLARDLREMSAAREEQRERNLGREGEPPNLNRTQMKEVERDAPKHERNVEQSDKSAKSDDDELERSRGRGRER